MSKKLFIDKEGFLGLKDYREHSSKRSKNRELTDAEKMAKLKANSLSFFK